MSLAISVTQDDVYTALETFLSGIVPTGVPVIRGLPNRAAMPQPNPGFIVMQALMQDRLNMPVHAWDYGASSPPSTLDIEQGIELPVQIDCYGATSGDWAATITTAFEDQYGFDALGPNCEPLYANQARMMPLIDSEEQYEERWSIDAHLQINPVVTITQQFADQLDLSVVNVTEKYPT